MGRLTLNMLLSFAQFEREVTGERIRDKIAASKKKGMWMGGLPPLGYDVKDRKLVVNERRPRRSATSSGATSNCDRCALLKAELDSDGIVSKVGEVRSDGSAMAASHSAAARSISCCGTGSTRRDRPQGKMLIRPNTRRSSIWSSGVRCRESSRQPRQPRSRETMRQRRASLRVSSSTPKGNALYTQHAIKRGRAIRYYARRSLITTRSDNVKRSSRNDKPGWRIPAPALEGLVKGRLIGFLETPTDVMDALADDDGRMPQPAKAQRNAPSDRTGDPLQHRHAAPVRAGERHPDRCSGQRGQSHPRSQCVEPLAGER